MPYIREERREEALFYPGNARELNFCITDLLIDYCKTHGVSYQTINDVIGALDSAKTEFNRRIVGPYEDTKLMSNGDVYGSLFAKMRSIDEFFEWKYGGLDEDWAFDPDDPGI